MDAVEGHTVKKRGRLGISLNWKLLTTINAFPLEQREAQ